MLGGLLLLATAMQMGQKLTERQRAKRLNKREAALAKERERESTWDWIMGGERRETQPARKYSTSYLPVLLTLLQGLTGAVGRSSGSEKKGTLPKGKPYEPGERFA